MKKKNWQDLTLKELENRLRCMPEIPIPAELESKLFTEIPDRQIHITPKDRKWYFQIWNYGASTAAAVLIFALILSMNSALTIHAKMMPTELNDTSLSSPGFYQLNSLYDQNDAPVAPFLLKDFNDS